MKKLMIGNEAVARGLYEAGVRLVSSYPGTPSTEITEFAAKYDEIYAEWAPNEKVALEVALGGSIAGGRTFCGMKHVGLNVAADPLFITSYTGIGGGMLICVADDPGMHSSQNEQDSRHYAIAAKLPMLEPSDSAECCAFAKAAFDLSERFDTPFILRSSTRVAHSQSLVEIGEREERPLREYSKDASKYVMMPANARPRHAVVEERLDKLRAFAEITALNRIELNSGKLGIITAGSSYIYARECFGEEASYFKLGMINPLPLKSLADFASKFERVIVIEELDPVIETQVRSAGIKNALGGDVEGKNLLPLTGEFSSELLKELILGEKADYAELPDMNIPPRPPALCSGCPHRGTLYVFKKLGLTVFGDIGCYTLGAAQPLAAMDTTLCMGASISAAHGFSKIRGAESAGKTVAVIGDSTFMHSGMTGLADITYNMGIMTVVIVDNSITGMTGHQQNPCTGLTLKNQPTYAISLEAVAEALGVEKAHIRVVDPYDITAFENVLKEELEAQVPSVIICRRPCVLLKYVKAAPPLSVDTEKCRSCKACMSIGCPSLSFVNRKAVIDETLCVGCGVCSHLCRFGAIGGKK
ncbi:MAG: indolepyruvate ferredoxin oxidoreductase subunit alpha [Clostridia bacterium]|nr:indolepyruvate ferredoxin oxidoreductase subunit alpha [Clostridia bacterium]